MAEQGVLNNHVLLPLKLYLSEHLGLYNKRAIIDEMLSRNDLPGEYTRGALLDKAAILLKEKNWSEAEQIADQMLENRRSSACGLGQMGCRRRK